MKVAIVHDWLTGMRGGEKVLEALCRLFPQAELFTLVHRRGAVSPTIENRRVHRSLVHHLPLSATRYREYLPLFPFAIEQFDFDGFDLVISSSHCAAKSVVVPGRTAHVCYCHSPMRYAWDQFEAYFGEARVGRVASAMLRREVGGDARPCGPRLLLPFADAVCVGSVRRVLRSGASGGGRQPLVLPANHGPHG